MDEIERLKALLEARKGRAGYKQSVKEIERRIAELEAANGG
jgi:hypothetical protein